MSFYHFAYVICNAFVKVGFKFRAEGVENLPQTGGYILCSNHRSYLDPIFLGVKVKRQLAFMAKEELFRVKLLGPIIKKLGAFPIARGKGDTRAVEFAIDTVKSGKALMLFPEGTRSKDGKLLKLKSGAIVIASQSQGLIVPSAIIFEGKLRFRRKVTVRYGKPISCDELEINGADRQSLKAAREKLSARISELLEVGN
jgi:1-acyl-sn-glycerol-3-phosphate acyltransferase